MGKNMTIYFSDDVLELIQNIEGKGTLINELIREHYSKDEETLRRKVDMISQEYNSMIARLNLKVEQREEKQAESVASKKVVALNLKQFEKDKAVLTKKAKGKDITFDEYKQAVDMLREKYGF